jgi:methylmalonyl-CoA/ethylmalonyl-CoA epimerase
MSEFNSLTDFLKFHHIGIAVKSFEKSLNFYKILGYTFSTPVVDEIQQVELIFCKSPDFPDIELIKPFGEKSPVANFLKDKEEAMYHQCYQTINLKFALDYLKEYNTLICVSKPKPAILFENKKVSFYYIGNVGLLEILEVNEYE